MAVEDKHLEALKKIESGIIQIYDNQPDLIDAEVLAPIEALARFYGGQAIGKTVTLRPLRGLSAEVATKVQETCELLLGRTSENLPIAQKTLPEIVDCLKKIQSSIKFWSKEYGRQGYLDYVKQFL